MPRRYYSNIATPTSLTSAINSAVTTITVPSTAGYPATPFLISIDRGTASEEIILVAGKTATQFTGCTRGYDGTTAAAHLISAPVEHVVAAIDYDEFAGHVYDVGLDHHTQYLNPFRHGTITHTTDMLGDGSVTTVKLGSAAVTAAKMAVNSVGNTQLQSASVSADKIVPGSLSSASGALGAINMADVSIGTLSASRLSGGTLSANLVSGGTLTGVIIDAAAITTGLMSASRISGGTAGAFNGSAITNLSASAITSGGMSAGFITSGTMPASRIAGGSLSGVTIDGVVITGGTVRSAASGKRVEIQSGIGEIALFHAGGAAGNIYGFSGGVGVTTLTSNSFVIATSSVFAGAGDVANPSFSFNGETTTGIYRSAVGELSFSNSGSRGMYINAVDVVINRQATFANRMFAPGMTVTSSGGLVVERFGSAGNELYAESSSGDFKANQRLADPQHHKAGLLATQIFEYDTMVQYAGTTKPVLFDAPKNDFTKGTIWDRTGPIVQQMAQVWPDAVIFSDEGKPVGPDRMVILTALIQMAQDHEARMVDAGI